MNKVKGIMRRYVTKSSLEAGHASVVERRTVPDGIGRIEGLALVICIVLQTSAFGAEAKGQGEDANDGVNSLPEVKVSAERRETKLQKTPVTVNAVQSEELQRRGVAKLQDLAGLAAGVNFPGQWANTQSVFIRGIGSSRPIGNPSVGWYVDDVYIPRSFGSSYIGNLPDIDRIEILHGPQGTLYGQNTSSGALRLISRQPTEKFNAWASIGAGNQGQIETRGYANGTLSPGLLVGSLAVATSHVDGDVDDLTTGKSVDGYENQQFRGILRLTPENGLVATLTLDGLHGTATSGSTPLNWSGTGVRKNFSDYGKHQQYNSGGVSLKLEHGLTDTLSWKSVTAVRGFNVHMPSDDPYPTLVLGFDQDLYQRQISQEFQLFGDYERFNFITGLMLWHEVFKMDRLSWTSNNYSIIDSKSTTSTAGLYGQGTYHVTDRLGLTAGLRLSKEWRDLDAAGYSSDEVWDRLSQTYQVNGLSKTYQSATPKVSLDYQWTPNLLVYASWAIGQTSGGWNAAPATKAIAEIPVDPEKVTASELGLKTSAFDGRFHGNLSLFYNDYRDYQASINNPVIDGVSVPGAVIVNAGKAHTYGAEWESALQAANDLRLTFNLAYLRTRFDEFVNPTGAANTDFTGYELPYAPRWSGSFGALYTHVLAAGARLQIGGDVRAEASSYSAVSAYSEYTKFPATHYLDASVAYTGADGKWTFSLTAKNLLGKTYVLPGYYVPTLDYYSVNYNRARQWLLSVRRDFQ
ncbi:MAG: TonB-dependent receptor [Pseudoxanthomonas sp.]